MEAQNSFEKVIEMKLVALQNPRWLGCLHTQPLNHSLVQLSLSLYVNSKSSFKHNFTYLPKNIRENVHVSSRMFPLECLSQRTWIQFQFLRSRVVGKNWELYNYQVSACLDRIEMDLSYAAWGDYRHK